MKAACAVVLGRVPLGGVCETGWKVGQSGKGALAGSPVWGTHETRADPTIDATHGSLILVPRAPKKKTNLAVRGTTSALLAS